MRTYVTMATGQHTLHDPVTSWTIEVSDDRSATILLVASIRPRTDSPISPIPVGATTLAFPTDHRVAKELYEKLGELGRSMGWLPQQ